jgi:hypothetical protein
MSFLKFLFAYLVAFVTISYSGSDNSSSTKIKTCKLFKVTNQNYIITFDYDINDKIIQLKNTSTISSTPRNKTSTFVYDAAGKLTNRKETNSSGTREFIFSYKANGQLEKYKINPSQEECIFEYNSDGKISKVITANNTKIYTYGNGNFTSRLNENTDNSQTLNYLYDNKNNFNSSLQDGFPDQPEYNCSNNIISEITTNPLGELDTTKYTYIYNAKGLPTKVTIEMPNLIPIILTLEYTDCE